MRWLVLLVLKWRTFAAWGRAVGQIIYSLVVTLSESIVADAIKSIYFGKTVVYGDIIIRSIRCQHFFLSLNIFLQCINGRHHKMASFNAVYKRRIFFGNILSLTCLRQIVNGLSSFGLADHIIVRQLQNFILIFCQQIFLNLNIQFC